MTIARDLANVASLMASSSANVVFDDSIVVTGGTANAFAYLDANKRLTTASIPPGGVTYTYRTSNYTASNLDGVLTDTANGSFTVTLPATPSTGNYVVVADAGNSWGNNNLTVARNGSTIGELAEDLVCDITGARLELVYDGTTWEVYAQVGGQGGNVVTSSTRVLNGILYFDSSNNAVSNSNLTFNGTTLTAPAFSGSGASLTSISNSATTAASANGASTIVARDAAGNFVANTISLTNFAVGVASPAANTKVDILGSQAGNIVAVAALDIDCSTGNYFTKTIAADSTFTFSNPPASRAYGFTLELTHTSGVVTWPVAVKWPSDTPPTLTTGKTHLFVFVTDDGGSRWRGSSLVNYTN